MNLDTKRLEELATPERWRTHYDGCYYDSGHLRCALLAALNKIEELRALLRQARASALDRADLLEWLDRVEEEL